MNAAHNQRSNTVITRLIQFAFALMLVFTSLAASGCGVVDSNGGDDIVAVSATETTPEAAGLQDIEDGNSDESLADPVKEEVCTIINGSKVCS